MTLWTAAEATRATGGTTNTDWTASGVSIDSRSLQPGDLFVALNAARDGHEFVADALAKGACAALVSRMPPGASYDAPLLTVADVQQGLEDLGRAARARASARLWPSPARQERHPPKKCCAKCSPHRAQRMPRWPVITTIGGCL